MYLVSAQTTKDQGSTSTYVIHIKGLEGSVKRDVLKSAHVLGKFQTCKPKLPWAYLLHSRLHIYRQGLEIYHETAGVTYTW